MQQKGARSMCLTRRKLTPKARLFLVIGNLCLSAGLLLGIFARDLGPRHPNLFDALRGLLLGIAIALNFGALVLARRNPRNST